MKRRMALLVLLTLVATIGCSKASAPANSNSGAAQTQTQPAANTADRLVPEITLFLPAPNYIQTQYDAGSIAAKGWEQLGVKVKLVTHPDWATFVGMVPDRSKWDAAEQGFVANPSRLDPDEFVTRMFLSQYAGEKGTNYGGYKNPDYDKIALAQQNELDPEKRRALVFQAQQMLIRDLPAISMFHDNTISVYNSQKFDNPVSVPGIGLMNIYNFTQAKPKTSDTTLVTSYIGQVRSINPMNAPAWDIEQEFQRLVYDTLARIGPDGKVHPWAATSWQVVNPTTIDITLRQGMKFHDGQAVTAEDVAFSFNYVKAGKVGSYTVPLAQVKAAEAQGPDKVRITLEKPYAPLFSVTFTQVPILPKHIWDGLTDRLKLKSPAEWDNAQMIGSGPFKFSAFRQGQELVLVKNPDHWQAPKVDRLILRLFSSAESRFLAMKKGEVHFHESKGLTPSQNIEAKTDPTFSIISEPGADIRWLDFNMTRLPFQDYNFRKALVTAVDFGTIETDILKGQGSRGMGFVPPGNTFWHDPKAEYPAFSINAAKEILKAAGYEWDANGRLLYPKDFKPQILGVK